MPNDVATKGPKLSQAVSKQEIDLVLPMVSPAERAKIVRSFEDAGFLIRSKSDRLLESAGEVATLIAINIVSSAVWDFIKMQFPKAMASIRGKLKKREPIFQLVVRGEHGWTIYTLPAKGESEALEAILIDFEAHPLDKDHRSWRAGEWLSAQRYARDKDYAEELRKKLGVQKPASEPNPNGNEPAAFANDGADLDPESDTGEPEGGTDSRTLAVQIVEHRSNEVDA